MKMLQRYENSLMHAHDEYAHMRYFKARCPTCDNERIISEKQFLFVPRIYCFHCKLYWGNPHYKKFVHHSNRNRKLHIARQHLAKELNKVNKQIKDLTRVK